MFINCFRSTKGYRKSFIAKPNHDQFVESFKNIFPIQVDSPKFRGAVKTGLADLMYYIVLYMQITDTQVCSSLFMTSRVDFVMWML